jgi:glycerophosphoryl diester phosphodiesterase
MAKRYFKSFLTGIVLVHAGLFLAFWLTNATFYAQTNDYLADKIGTRLDYIRLCLMLTFGLSLWSGSRLLLAPLGRSHCFRILSSVVYSLCSLIFIVFFYGSFWLLFRESPSQMPRIQQLILYYRMILDVLILGAFLLLSVLWLHRLKRFQPAPGRQAYLLNMSGAVGLLVLIWAVVLVFPPGSIYKGSLPEKPHLIAHRGAASLAPENTLASMELAASIGAYGLETDLRISLDGVSFLMHDDTLERTTDAAMVYPGREKERVEGFTLAEIQQLNAGQWFLQVDPFGTLASRMVTNEQAQSYQHQVIPTLAEVLEIASKHEKIFLFDLKQPPDEHPYRKQFFDIVFEQIQASKIDSQIWFLANIEQAGLIGAEAPQMILVHGTDYRQPPAPDDLFASGYQVINADFSLSPEWIQVYKEAGLWVNLYTVDETWQYSRLWLLGVDSITSNNLSSMLALQRPVFSLPFSTYIALWTGLGLLSAGLMVGTSSLASPLKHRIPAAPAGRPG